MTHPAAFLDRDGVINRDRSEFVKSWEEFEFLPSSLEALAVLARAPYRIVVVSNQSGVGRGLLTETVLQEIHIRMIDRIRSCGGRIDAVFYCPHLPDSGCSCRKPAPGLFFTAARDMGIDLASSWAVGDRYRDVEAANRAGVQAILLNRSLADPHENPEPKFPFFRANDLLDAVQLILSPARVLVGGERIDGNS